MNQNFRLLAAVDIGTTKVVATVARKYNDGQMEVLGIERTPSTGVRHGMILNIEETVNAIRKVIDSLERRLSIRISEVYVGLSAYSMKSISNGCSRFIDEDKEITSFDIEQLRLDNYRMSLEPGEKIIHVIPQEYIVDNELAAGSPVGMFGHRLEGTFHVVIGRVNAIRNIEKCLVRAGLTLAGLVLEPLASAYGVLSEEEMEAGVVVVDIGGGTTDVVLFCDGVVRYTGVVPFGGNVVTSDIKEGCSVIQKQAEALKVQFGSAMSKMTRKDMVVAIPGMPGWEPKEISCRSLACIIQARMEEIVEYVAYHIRESGFYDKLGAGVVLTGGGALLKNIVPLVKLKTGLDVKIGSPVNFLSNDEGPSAEMPLLSSGIGLLVASSVFSTQKVVEQKLFENPEDDENDISRQRPIRKKAKKTASKGKTTKDSTDGTGDLFGNLRNKIVGIFEDRDVEM
jgi:cell division protein FtsA